eukprot:1161142-Pelagomonas_calceolata.AAC.3
MDGRMDAGLNEELLQQLLLDDKGHGSRDQQSLQQDWRTVGAAVEGVMQAFIRIHIEVGVSAFYSHPLKVDIIHAHVHERLAFTCARTHAHTRSHTHTHARTHTHTQVYINRSNSRFITNGDWVKPRVVDGHGTLAHGAFCMAHFEQPFYSHGAETMVAQSMVALLYIDTGHLVKVGDEDNTLAAVRSNKNWKPLVPPGTFS